MGALEFITALCERSGDRALAVLQRVEQNDPARGIEQTLSDSARVPGFDLEDAMVQDAIPDALLPDWQATWGYPVRF